MAPPPVSRRTTGSPLQARNRGGGLRFLEVSQRNGGRVPAVPADGALAPLESRFQQGFIDGHIPDAALRLRLDHEAAGSHLRIGLRAACTSSGRLIAVECGARCRNSGSSATMRWIASANASRVSFDSVSVGSIIIASGTTSGK